jgi:hypothetical protein
MARRRRGLAGALVGIVFVTALAPTAAASVTLDVTVDGDPVADGDTVTVTDDPVLGVEVVGTVADGRVTRVVIASVGPDGDVVDELTVCEGAPASRMDVRGRVAGTRLRRR